MKVRKRKDVEEQGRIGRANAVLFERQLFLVSQTTAENPPLGWHGDAVDLGHLLLELQQSRGWPNGICERSTMRRSILDEDFYAAANPGRKRKSKPMEIQVKSSCMSIHLRSFMLIGSMQMQKVVQKDRYCT